ncbi:MAG: lytic transglycosylase domain-containing protein [Desulfobacca sp.]
MESIFNQNPSAPTAPGRLPEPQSSRVQVFIFKKGMVLLSQKPGLPPALVPGVPGRRLSPGATDPRLSKIINKYASQQGIDPRLVQVVIRHESGFDPTAVSPKGAMGLMQLMPETAAALGVEDPFDVEQNIKGGIRFLKICLNRFDQNLPLALAAYNAGPGRVVEHQGMPPLQETQDYVKKVVQDYNGQSLDAAQIKLRPAAAVPAVTALAQAPAAPPPASVSKPLNLLPLFIPPALDIAKGTFSP